MKEIAIKYIEEKIGYGVTDFAFGTKDGYIVIINAETVKAFFEEKGDEILRDHDGIRVKALTYNGNRNLTVRAFLRKAWKVIECETYKGAKGTESAVSEGGKLIGGLKNHKYDVIFKEGAVIHRIEVKGVGGLMMNG